MKMKKIDRKMARGFTLKTAKKAGGEPCIAEFKWEDAFPSIGYEANAKNATLTFKGGGLGPETCQAAWLLTH